MPTIVIYPDNLLLNNPEVNSKNEISGWVINGQWYYKEVQGRAYALRSREASAAEAVNSWEIQPRKIIVVREKFTFSEYNDVLSRYENQPDETENLIDVLCVECLEEHNTRDRPSTLELDDIDIPF